VTTITELSEAIDASLATIDGLRHHPYPPSQFHYPHAFPVLQSWEPIAMGRQGLITYAFKVFVLTAKSTNPKDGYEALMSLADNEGGFSVALAIWDGNNTDAAGAAEAGSYRGVTSCSMQVTGFSVLGEVEAGAHQSYGGSFDVLAHTRSS
jgi:hypothetical protein